jgi:transcriptional regulator with XRE-family HTH domain
MLSETLKQLRKKNYLNQSEFAKKIGVSQSAVSQWEHDQTRPNSYQLQSISDAFGISIDELLGDETRQDHGLELTDTEYKLILAYRKADHAICEAAFDMLEKNARKKEILAG